MIKLNPKKMSELTFEAEIFSHKKQNDINLVIKTPNVKLTFESKDNKFNIQPFNQMVEGISEAEFIIECDCGDRKLIVAKDKVMFDHTLSEGVQYIENETNKYNFITYLNKHSQELQDSMQDKTNIVNTYDPSNPTSDKIKEYQKFLSDYLVTANQGQK